MKIAVFHELHKGGARKATNEFSKSLKKLGHEVDLFTIRNGQPGDEKSFYNNIKYFEFKTKKWRGNNWKTRLYKDTVELIKVYLLDRDIAFEINKRKYDLVLVSASDFIESPFVLNFIKIPKFFYCHDPYYRIIYEPELFNKKGVSRLKLFYESLNRVLRKYIDIWNIKKADYIIFNSKFTKSLFEKTYKIRGKVSYIGINTSFFTPSDVKKDIDVLYIGSREFLDGYTLLKDIKKKLNSKIKIKEVLSEDKWLSDQELRSLYRRSKILFAPAFKEPLGLVPLEAMACGAVVVAVDDGGHRETIIEGKTGFIVENNAVKMTEKINFLLSNSNILNKMSKEAVKYVCDVWNWNTRGKELEKYLLKQLKND